MPGIQAGWISLRQGESGFRLAAARNLPPALASPGALGGSCECRRRLLFGELDSVTNIIECERLAKAKGDARGLRCHASVPLWIRNQMVGVINLAGPGDGLFNEEELKVLYSVGNQVAVAMERAKMQGHLEKLVEERTAALKAEVEERRRIQEEQARLVAILDATPDFVATGMPDGPISYITRLPINALKIDRAFIVNMTGSPVDLSIVSTIISLAHSLNLRVIAEGVETQEQANLLRLLKCDEIQGYLFSPAVPAERIEIFLKENKSLSKLAKGRALLNHALRTCVRETDTISRFGGDEDVPGQGERWQCLYLPLRACGRADTDFCLVNRPDQSETILKGKNQCL